MTRMGSWRWVVGGGLVLLLGLAWLGLRSSGTGHEETVRAAPAPAQPAAELPPSAALLRPGARTSAEVAPAPPGKEAASVESGMPTTGTFARVRFVDVHGTPVEGGELVLCDEELASALSARDGVARLDIGSALAGLTTQDLTFEARARGFARDRKQALATSGEELLLGDWTLIAAGTVEGRVVDEDGEGLAGIEVACASEALTARDFEWRRRAPLAALARPGARTTSGPDGAFRLEDAPAGKQRLVAVSDERPAALSEPVDVPPGGLVGEVELEMEAADGGTTITGLVLDPQGAPVPYAHLAVRGRGSSSQLATDSDGRFTFRALDLNPVDLVASDPEGQHRDAVQTGVRPGTKGIELQLVAAPALEVVVRNPSGDPIERFAVALLAERTREGLAFFAEQERPAGRFATAAPAEAFAVEVRASGWRPRRLGPFEAGAARRVECVLEPAPGLMGTVTSGGLPVAGAHVALHAVLATDETLNGLPIRLDPDPGPSTETARDGSFLLSVEERGRYALLVEAAGHALAELGPFDLAPEREQQVAVELDTGGTLAVRVRSAQGAAVAGRLVVVSRGDGRARTRRADERGELELPLLTPGPWWVALAEQEIDPRGGVRTFGTEPAREIPSNCRVQRGQVTTLDLWLEESGARCRLSGRLTLDGQPARGWQVALDRERTVVHAGQAFDEPGAFRIAVEGPGTYRLRLMPGTADPSAMLAILETLELAEGDQQWSLELHTGQLVGSGLDGTLDALHLFRIQRGTRELMVPLVPDAGGSFHCALAPAGVGEIVRYDASSPVEEQRPLVLGRAAVEPGRTTQVDL